MGKLWRRTQKGETGKDGLVEVDLQALEIRRPSVIFLTGFFTYDTTPQHIRSALKTMAQMMADRPGSQPPADVYAWSHAGLKEIFNLAAYDIMPGSRSSKNGYRLAAAVIMPLVAKDFKRGAQGDISGTPLPPAEAKKNLRNVTFFGYSAGTITAQETFNAALKMMKKIGYAEKDARDALHEVALVSVGVMSRPGRERDRFTTLYLEATNDKLVNFKNRMWAPLRSLFSWFANKLRIQPLSDSSALISAAVRKRNWEMRRSGGAVGKQEVKTLLPRWFPVKSYHELPRYVTEDEGLSPFAKIVEYSLTNAVARTRRLSPLELMEPPQAAAPEDAAAYKAKIAKAVIRPRKT